MVIEYILHSFYTINKITILVLRLSDTALLSVANISV